MNEQHENNEQFANQKGFTPLESNDSPTKHSGLGIASFVLSIIGIVSFVVLTIVIIALFTSAIDFSAIVDSNNNRLMTDQEIVDKIQPYVGYLVLYPLLLGVVLIGLILGIIALARPGYKKIFAVLGTILNGLPLALLVILIIIGLAVA